MIFEFRTDMKVWGEFFRGIINRKRERERIIITVYQLFKREREESE